MISIEEALQIVHQQDIQTTSAHLPLAHAPGYYLAAPIEASFDIPSFDNSAMDGYAVRGNASSFQIVGEVPAGDTSEYALEEGTALRIFTGSKVPAHTTAVVIQEHTQVEATTLYVQTPITAGQHIRPKGKEVTAGQTVFTPGHYLSPASLGLIGSLGISTVSVFQKPTVRLIVTGNELILPGQPRQEGQIYESNSYALAGAMQAYGFECQETQLIRDDYQATKSGIADFLETSDVLLLSGGISVGAYDFVKQALTENGVEELFYRVFQKPGKPLYFGRKGHTFVFALPGNPASSLTCFYIYVLPLLQRLSGAAHTGLPRISVPLAHDFDMPFSRPTFFKAHLSHQQVTILDKQSSSMLHSMAMGNALAFIQEQKALQAGEPVTCVVL